MSPESRLDISSLSVGGVILIFTTAQHQRRTAWIPKYLPTVLPVHCSCLMKRKFCIGMVYESVFFSRNKLFVAIVRSIPSFAFQSTFSSCPEHLPSAQLRAVARH